ncbi:tetratricopeptide repeat protein [Limibacter armeniacum]|uniref:tetratricopeptide repeat protein n=1 Tax=Limibacter armeniacum TaxID=466084 RepID=UPI002FE6B450
MRTSLFTKYLLPLLTVILFAVQAYTQSPTSKVDSLRHCLSKDLTSESRLKILLELGNKYQSRNLDSAYLYAKTALTLGEEENLQDSLLVHVHNLLGRTYTKKGKFDQAITHFISGMKQAEALEDKALYIKLLINMGVVHFRLGDIDKWEETCLESIRLIEESASAGAFPKKILYLSSIYNNLAIIYEHKKDTVKIMEYYDKALTYSIANNDKRNISLILNNIGNIQLGQGKMNEAYTNIHNSLQIRRAQDDTKGMAQNYDNLGRYFLRLSQLDSAEFYFQKGIAASKITGDLTDHINLQQGLIKVYEAKGQFERALQEQKLHETLNDSLYNLRMVMEIAEMEYSYDFEKEQAANKLELEKKRFNTYLIISLIFFLTVLVAMGSIFYLKLQKRTVERERETLSLSLDYKNKEMVTKALYQYKKQELIHRVIQQLKDLSEQMEAGQVSTIQKVIKNLEQGTKDETWAEFELLFNETHQDFYKTLEQKFPNLTPNEKRLCAFVKLNMTSKEISSLTGQSVRSINVARTRLRKKLQLTNMETSLADFFAAV